MIPYNKTLFKAFNAYPDDTGKVILQLINAALDQREPSKELRRALQPLLTMLTHRDRLR